MLSASLLVERSSGLGVLPRLPEKIAASLSSSSGLDELFKATPRRGEVAGVVDLLKETVIVWPGIDLG